VDPICVFLCLLKFTNLKADDSSSVLWDFSLDTEGKTPRRHRDKPIKESPNFSYNDFWEESRSELDINCRRWLIAKTIRKVPVVEMNDTLAPWLQNTTAESSPEKAADPIMIYRSPAKFLKESHIYSSSSATTVCESGSDSDVQFLFETPPKPRDSSSPVRRQSPRIKNLLLSTIVSSPGAITVIPAAVCPQTSTATTAISPLAIEKKSAANVTIPDQAVTVSPLESSHTPETAQGTEPSESISGTETAPSLASSSQASNDMTAIRNDLRRWSKTYCREYSKTNRTETKSWLTMSTITRLNPTTDDASLENQACQPRADNSSQVMGVYGLARTKGADAYATTKVLQKTGKTNAVTVKVKRPTWLKYPYRLHKDSTSIWLSKPLVRIGEWLP